MLGARAVGSSIDEVGGDERRALGSKVDCGWRRWDAEIEVWFKFELQLRYIDFGC